MVLSENNSCTNMILCQLNLDAFTLTGITRGVQWIQRVYSNHSLNPDQHGFIENILDINVGQTTPYYRGSAGNGLDLIPPKPYRFFADRPYRVDPVESHFWEAELYLVSEEQDIVTRKRTVTIYNGIKWGWKNNSRLKSTCNGSSGGGGCLTVTATNSNALTNRELPLSDFDSSDPNQSPEAVPEPTSAFGALLAMWGLGTLKRLKKPKT
ncbi:hypothetical protein QUA81_31065 [Microcoleus sp. F6_B4]